jgi:hypothetical protein
MSVTDYIHNKNGLFARATNGRITQLMALRKLLDATRQGFKTAHVAVSNGHYIVALNIPWWGIFILFWRRQRMEQCLLQWVRLYDPQAESVKILRKAKNLEKEQVVLF